MADYKADEYPWELQGYDEVQKLDPEFGRLVKRTRELERLSYFAKDPERKQKLWDEAVQCMHDAREIMRNAEGNVQKEIK